MKAAAVLALVLMLPLDAFAEESSWQIFFRFEAETFSIRASPTQVEAIVSHSGRVKRRAIGPPSPAFEAARRALTGVSATQRAPSAWRVVPSDLAEADYFAIVGPTFFLEGVVGKAMPETRTLLEAARALAASLPKADMEGLYILAFPIAALPPEETVITASTLGEEGSSALALAFREPGGAVRVNDAQKLRHLPKQSMFNLALTRERLFLIQYWQGAPFSLADWLQK